jgi:hypothetical protein
VKDTTHRIPGHPTNVVATLNHALISLKDGKYVDAMVERGADHGANGGVHPWRVAAAG